MALSKERRQAIVKAGKIADAIKGLKDKESSAEANSKVDLTKLAKDLSKRRESAMSEED